jgi:hypothetical protein
VLQVFITPRVSISDVHSSPHLPLQQQLLLFDSLASLPTQLPPHMVQQPQECGNSRREQHDTQQQQQQQQAAQQPNMEAVEAIAAFLRSRLGLTLFGFDVVVASNQAAGTVNSGTATVEPAVQQQQQAMPPEQQQQQQELVVIDVNYFPNYRGGSNTPALFREALLQRWQQHTAGLAGK